MSDDDSMRMTRVAAALLLPVALFGAVLAARKNASPIPPAATVLPAHLRMESRDSVIRAAQLALDDGRPWLASRLLQPLVDDPARRTADVVLLAAEAASAWEGWGAVIDLLRGAVWLDTARNGHGHVLLARAALARGTGGFDSLALVHARRAAEVHGASGSDAPAAGEAERGRRETLLARAHDRLQHDDSARAHYLRAASLIPDVGDWLRLRAAGVTRTEDERRRLLGEVRLNVTRERVPWTEAFALERSGDLPAAAVRFDSLGARASGFRLRVAGAAGAGERATLRAGMLAFLATAPAGAEVRTTIDVLDRASPTLSPSEELAVARSARVAGLTARAIRGYERGLASGAGSDRDRFWLAEALLRVGRARDAAAQFARIPASSPLGGAAAYQRARALQRSGSGAVAALGAVLRDFPDDSAAAAPALFLLGDLATDAGNDDEARERFRALARRFPGSPHAPAALFRAAVIALARSDAASASRELDSLVARYPGHAEALAAQYWSANAWARRGQRDSANARWRALASRSTPSYYQMMAARALGLPAWQPPAVDVPLPVVPAIDSAMRRAVLLERLGLHVEAEHEDDHVIRAAGTVADRLLAAASGFAARGQSSRAMSLARRALGYGAPATPSVYRLLYPMSQGGVLRAESRARGLDPALVAALIRQESSFTPRATSIAGARGLMQVMPDVGRALARGLGFGYWDPVLLYQPDVNVQLGTRHLATALRRYPDPAYALAAYNAGDSRVRRWRTKPGSADPALFTERIPFVETRDYVRIVLTNRELYRVLYTFDDRLQ